MFDLSWTELLFVATLALIVVGPKDMPKLFKMVGRFFVQIRRMYAEFVGGMHQLEQEIDIASTKTNGKESWKEFIPEEIRNLPDDFVPGSMTAEEHQQRRQAWHEAHKKAENPVNDQPQADKQSPNKS